MMSSNYSSGMGKKILFIFMILTNVYIGAFSQVSINNTNAIPHTSSMLDISSINKGLLIPRMSMAEMTAISSPAEGLLVYVNSGASGLYQYRSGNWEKLFAFSGSLTNGGVLFGSNASFAQNNNHFFWNDTQKYLGLGTNTPNSTLSVTNTNSQISWIAADFGDITGSRLIMGNLSGNPTIGATTSALTTWDTLAINPGGQVSMPFYAGLNARLLAIKSSGVLSSLGFSNGLLLENDTFQLGGRLSKNTNILLNRKQFSLQGGSPGQINTVSSNSSPDVFAIFTDFGQSFVTQTNGILNKVSILMGHDQFGFLGYYEVYLGNGYGGPIIATDNIFIPTYNSNIYVDIPLNIAVTEGQFYTIRIHTIGNTTRHAVASDNIQGILFHGFSNLSGVDLTLKIYETETVFDLLKVDGQTKTVAIEGNSSKLKISSLEGTGIRNVVVSSNGTLGAISDPLGTVTNVTGEFPIQVSNNNTTPMVSISQATSTVAGYLSPGDYNVFNNKQNALPNATSVASGILTSTDWVTFNNKQSATSFAGTSSNGVLSGTDWNTFNNKQSATSFANAAGSGVLSSTDWNTFNNKQSASSFSGATSNGVLSMTDWNTFNNKQSTTNFASTSTNGVLSSTDWNIFNNKYNLPSLTSGSLLFSDGNTLAQKNSHLYWDNTNNALGIGTNTPSAGLNIHGYGWNNGFRISQSVTGGVGPAIYLDGDRDFAIISTSSGASAGANRLNIYDATADQSRIVIDQNGAMGIGENAPTSKLQVTGTAGLKVSSDHTGTGYVDWISGNFGGQEGKRVVIGVFDTIATIGAHNNTLDQWRNIAINPSASGNVGIGTTNPQYKLDVNGSQRVTGNLTVIGNIKQSVHQISISVPAATYPVINPFVGGSTTPTYGETTAIWVHNLGYNPVIMTSFDFSAGGYLHHVNVSYRHVDNDAIEFYFSNASVNVATGLINVIVVN